MARKKHTNSQGFEDVSSYSSSKEYKKRRGKRRVRAVLRGIAIFFCLVFILCGSGLVYVSTNLLGKYRYGQKHQKYCPVWRGCP